MRFLIDILHPAHVHFFRPFIAEMSRRGHEFLILSRRKDVTVDLLDSYGLEHRIISTMRPGAANMAVELARRAAAIVGCARRFRPNYLLGLMGPAIAVAGRVLPARTVVFYDNETTHKINRMVVRLADAWWSPRAFRYEYGRKHHRYDGYHELTYLHPNRFTPDPAIPAAYGLEPAAPYFVIRFVSWEAVHDTGESGFSTDGKARLIEGLSQQGRVLISSEKPLPAAFEPYRLPIPVHDIHHVLAFARLLIGESSTMASEAAILGTHAVYVSKTGRGVNDEQAARYGLSHNFHGNSEERALEAINSLATRPNLKEDAQARREELLKDTIDVTGFLVDYFEGGEQATGRLRSDRPGRSAATSP